MELWETIAKAIIANKQIIEDTIRKDIFAFVSTSNSNAFLVEQFFTFPDISKSKSNRLSSNAVNIVKTVEIIDSKSPSIMGVIKNENIVIINGIPKNNNKSIVLLFVWAWYSVSIWSRMIGRILIFRDM